MRVRYSQLCVVNDDKRAAAQQPNAQLVSVWLEIVVSGQRRTVNAYTYTALLVVGVCVPIKRYDRYDPERFQDFRPSRETATFSMCFFVLCMGV